MASQPTAIIPKTLFVGAVNALPVPQSLVGKISGVYMMLLTKLYAHCHPSNASDVVAVTKAYRKTPVKIVDIENVPFRPKRGSSTMAPPRSAPGTARTATMSEFRYVIYVEPVPNLAPWIA